MDNITKTTILINLYNRKVAALKVLNQFILDGMIDDAKNQESFIAGITASIDAIEEMEGN